MPSERIPVDVVDRPRTLVIEVDEDVCIACGKGSKTQAHVYAKYPDGVTAAFCGHHGTEQLPHLVAAGCRIVDLRYRIGS